MRIIGIWEKLFATVILGLGGTNCSTAQSLDYPAIRYIVHDQSGARNSVQMDCNIESRDKREINCQFFQMSVTYALDPDDYASKLDEEIKRVGSQGSDKNENPASEAKKICDLYSDNTSEFDKSFDAALGSRKEKYWRSMREIFIGACNLKTKEATNKLFQKLVRVGLEWEAKTCKVWPNVWAEKFSPEYTKDGYYWLSKSEPQGECGVLNISTLRKDDDYFWKYESRRVITNKEGDGGLIECSSFEDRSVVYSWRPKEHIVDCGEIKFQM
jgi:hypothetical protein